MALRKISFVICLFILTLSLAAGYAIAGYWAGSVIAILGGLAWLLARKYPDSWLPSICLLASVCLAVAGLLSGAPPVLMICGSGVALAVWDLLFLDHALGKGISAGQTRQFEYKHLQSLVIALGAGLLVASLGRLLNLRAPFVLMILLVALAAFGLERVWRYVKKGNIRSM